MVDMEPLALLAMVKAAFWILFISIAVRKAIDARKSGSIVDTYS
jgi:hypothetical protein